MTSRYCNHLCPCILECEATCALECKEGSKVTDIVKGARVRVDFEATVFATGDDWTGVNVTMDDRTSVYVPLSVITVIAPPECQFEDGAYYLSGKTVWRFRAADDSFEAGIGLAYPWHRSAFAAKELAAMVKLVPETSS